MGDGGIRPAAAADFGRVSEIVNHYIRTSTVNFRTEPQTPAEWERDWLAHSRVHPWYVAERDGVVVGIAYASAWKRRPAYDWTAETIVYLDREQRGRGLGAELYRRLLRTLERQGYRSAMAVVSLPNDASVRLHQALGYELVGCVRAAGFKFGRWHDTGLWQRMLSPGEQPPGPLLPVADLEPGADPDPAPDPNSDPDPEPSRNGSGGA